MKRDLVLFWLVAAGVAGSACNVDVGSISSEGGGGEGSTATVASTATGSSATGTSATGASATGTGGAGSEDDGGSPTDCAAPTSCGNFGAGCIECAVKTACATEYQACFNDAPCKSYSICIGSCAAEDDDCVEACATQLPSGAAEYQALIHCVICGPCVTACEHAPSACK